MEDDKNREQYIDAYFELDTTLQKLQSQIEVLKQIRRNDSISMYVLRLANEKGIERENNFEQQIELCDVQRGNDQLIISSLRSQNSTLKWGGGTLLILSIAAHFIK